MNNSIVIPTGITDKYEVTKKEGEPVTADLSDVEYFVLKRGDVFAVAALRSYAHNLAQVLDMEQAGLLKLTSQQRSSIVALADDALALASVWELEQPKLPD